MNRTEELILQSQKGESVATETLVNENKGLIWSVAKRFLGRGVDADDLYQLGCLGFLKAVEGFDVAFGTQFSTYAVPKISGEIRRFLRDDGAIKVSRSIKERSSAIRMAENRLMSEMGRQPQLSEISEATGFSPEEIAVATAATAATESIQQESGEEGFRLENVLTDTDSEEKTIEKIALRQAISRLEEREAMVINLRYYHGMTQQNASRIMNVSQVQISRIEKKAIGKLRILLS